MEFTADLGRQFVGFLLVFARITGMFVTAPMFGSRIIPVQVRVGFALIITILSTPAILSFAKPGPGSLLVLSWWIILEIIYGMSAGFVATMLFNAIQMAGQLIDMQIGFGIVNIFDPQFGQQVPLIGNFKYLLGLTIFLVIEGHHVILTAIVESFRAAPAGVLPAISEPALYFVDVVGSLFVMGLRIAMPVLGTVLLTDVALGILARVMPQMNVFVVGITGKIVVGIIMLFFALPFYVAFLEVGFEQLFRDVYRVLELMGRIVR